MLSSEQALGYAARDGSIDISEWPRVLENVLQRLHDIVHNDFPLPVVAPSTPLHSSLDPDVIRASPLAPLSPSSQAPPISHSDDLAESLEPLSQASSANNKENTAPSDPPPRPAVPSFSAAPNSQSTTLAPISALPPDLASSYLSSTHMLRHTFAQSPPYTVQRLAELVLYPRKHYRFLPPYLAALDRVVCVSSPVSDFPLPSLHVDGFLTNGGGGSANGISERGGLGSDESLGGALLTPIPWLRKEDSLANAAASAQRQDGELHSESSTTIDGPNGTGRIETVSVTLNGISSTPHLSSPNNAASQQDDTTMTTEQSLRASGAVTQGELLRQEQEAGVVPVGQVSSPRGAARGLAVSTAAGRDPLGPRPEPGAPEMPEEHPHARGPGEIGMEDMGPQHATLGAGGHLDMQAAAGRKSPQPAEMQLVANGEGLHGAREEGRAATEPGADVVAAAAAGGVRRDEAVDADGDVMIEDA